MVGEVDFRVLQKRVLEYAQKRGFFESIEKADPQEIFDFLITLLEQGLIPKRQPFNIDEVIRSHETMFLDWYFFEREHRGTKTIADLYAESEDIKKSFEGADLRGLMENIRGLKNPIWNAFKVIGKAEVDEYRVKPLDEEADLLVHDKSSFPKVNIGDWFFGKLYQFYGRCYTGSYLIPIPEDRMEKYFKTKSLCEELEEKFNEFMETKSDLSERTIRKYEEAFPLVLDYVKEKRYWKLSQVERLNVDAWIKWVRRRSLYVSRTQEDDCRTAINHFLRYLLARGLSPANPSRSP